MGIIAKVLIGLVALEHLYIMYFEMLAWSTAGRKVFSFIPKDIFETKTVKTLAANMGLYNSFLAVGLIWSLLISDPEWSKYIATFFLSCVVVAGIYGGMTASKRILYTQGGPAMVALLVLWLL